LGKPSLSVGQALPLCWASPPSLLGKPSLSVERALPLCWARSPDRAHRVAAQQSDESRFGRRTL